MPVPFVDVNFGQTRVSPVSFLARHSESAHEVVSFVLRPPITVPSSVGTPIKINWGFLGSAPQTFYGYLHTVEKQASTRLEQVKFTAIGASYVFRAPLQALSGVHTADVTAQSVANAFLFSAQTEPTAVVSPLIGGATAWEFLLDLAVKAGFACFVVGTELIFLRRLTLIERSASTAPLLHYGSNPVLSEVTLFRPILGDYVTTPRQASRALSGVDPRIGTPFATGVPPVLGVQLGVQAPTVQRTFIVTDTVADSPGAATSALNAQAENTRFQYSAQAETIGVPQLHAGMTVYFTGLDTVNDGFWYITAIEHVIDFSDAATYICYMELGRDSAGVGGFPTATGNAYVQFRRSPGGVLTGAPPPTIFANSIWRSAWARTTG